MTVKIVLVGKSKTGKTWVANYLRVNHGFKHVKFRSILDRFIKAVYEYRGYQQVKWLDRLKFYDAWYKIDPNIWIGHIEYRLGTTYVDVVIDDPRYINEVARLKELGFYVVRITAPPTLRNRYLQGAKKAEKNLLVLHEIYNKDFDASVGVDFSIHNDDKAVTRRLLDDLVEKLKKLDIETNVRS